MRFGKVNRSTLLALGALSIAQPAIGQVQHTFKIANTTAGVPAGTFVTNGWLGYSISDLGNLGPSARTPHALAVGAENDTSKGAVWIAFIRDKKVVASDPSPGTIESLVRITENVNGFNFSLTSAGRFGEAVAALGDIDGDGTVELAIGNSHDDVGGQDFGSVWIVSLNPDGTVAQHGVPSKPKVVKIAHDLGGFPPGELAVSDNFGNALAVLPDLDGNGVPELAVGAYGDDDGISSPGVNMQAGAVYILFLKTDGTVKDFTKLSDDGTANSLLPLGDNDLFGTSVRYVGERESEHVLAVGAIHDSVAGLQRGSVWMIRLTGSGSISGVPLRIADGMNGIPSGTIADQDRFGYSIAALGDRDNDGVNDIAVGADLDDEGGADAGAVYLVYLKPDDTVKSMRKITEGKSGFPVGVLASDDRFAIAADIGDIDGNGISDLAVGSFYDDAGGSSNVGAVWLLVLNQYGHGCPGSCGFVPDLTIVTPSTAGSPFTFGITGAFGGFPAQAIIFVGAQQSDLPMGAGCTLNVQPVIPVLNAPLGGSGCGNGILNLATTVPPGLAGTTLMFQAFTQDPGAVLGFTNTNGVAIYFSP